MDCLKDPDVSILIWVRGDWPTEEQTDRVLDWVKHGGGFIHVFDYNWWSKQSRYHFERSYFCNHLVLPFIIKTV